ncbi:MAG: hypothetical protein J6N72_05945 [Psychrobacter sp.]|nr:hypothetical protein [Psychrobacter sp.]
MNLSELLLAVGLVLLMVFVVVPYGHKLWRNWYWDINDKSEAEWEQMKKRFYDKSLESETLGTEKQNDEAFNAHIKLLIADFISKTKKAKYWTNYFLIFAIIMGGQFLYTASHLLNQYYGLPSIGNVNATSLQDAAVLLIYTSIVFGIYFYKKRDLKERQALLVGLADNYGVEGNLTLEKLEKIDMSKHKEDLTIKTS